MEGDFRGEERGGRSLATLVPPDGAGRRALATATLGWAALFLASAAVVVRSGLALSKAGDLLAEETGLGRLWVGTIFLAIATSLPELVTNLSAVRLDAPALAGGNVLGANMINIVVLAGLVSLFPAVGVRPMGRDQRWLVATALALTGAVTALVALGGPGNLGTVLVLGGYAAGMTAVYRTRAPELGASPAQGAPDPGGRPRLLGRGWVRFALAAGGFSSRPPSSRRAPIVWRTRLGSPGASWGPWL
ncbi:MAG: hypothetical protein NUV94_00005 [Candidatus Acetothermia bacterium]|jgi:cation:H+ antiporter|nr:hypothetical protein [Candidatus Acetothermia bacterium]